MNTLLLNLVSTNAGWLARQAVKYSAVGAAIITSWLVGHGLDATHASVIAAGATSIVLGLVEAGLSFIARKYATPELEGVNAAIEAAKKAAPVLIVALSLNSCATATAFLASPFGRATIATADQLAKQVLLSTERVGLEQIIFQASAKVAALKASGADPDIVKETLRLSQIAGFAGVVEAAQVKYQQLTGSRYTIPKNPIIPVTP